MSTYKKITQAIPNGDLETVKNLNRKIAQNSIKSGLPVFDYKGKTFFMWAILENHLDMTALHYAAQFGSVKGVKFLLKQNAEIDVFDKENYTPLMLALEKPTPYYVKDSARKIISKVQNAINDNSVLHSAASLGAADIVLSLIERGLDINTLGEENKTPLAGLLQKER
ncbi:MAG: ankyrin repeat domain-containing protein [bacterium]|nr:ankyrin repeat domain-containing protein [bacterium]